MRRTGLFLAAMMLAGAGPAERASDMLESAKSALAAAKTPQERLEALAEATEAEEAALAAIRIGLRAGADRKIEIGEGLDARKRRLSAVLSALQRIERAPRAATLAHPGGVVDGARAGMMLAALTPALKEEAGRLQALLDELHNLDELQKTASTEVRSSLISLQGSRAEIARLLRHGGDAHGRDGADAVSQEAEALARSAGTLKSLAPHISSGSTTSAEFTAAIGRLPPPAEGELAEAFGTDEGNGPLEGVEVETPPYAAITAPWRGVVRYASPFGEDGVVVMFEPEPDVLFVFAGLATTDRQPGDLVMAGEPLGSMGGPEPEAKEFLFTAASAGEANRTETLYMEVRRGGAPVDPATWFAFGNKEGDEK